MLISEIIRRKRDGETLDDAAIATFVKAISDGSASDAQLAALCMAIFQRSMNFAETAALTREMAASGRMLAWDDEKLGGPIVDKHSTGGVGDKVSLMLAPIAAACGCFVPMISGRGLGHTGGTLDKLATVPGYEPRPGLDRLREVVKSVGCAIVGQSDSLAPADARLYAVRDVTATVESNPLITASILSKKLAAGNDFLVMDIKFGSGAFMPDIARARRLASDILSTAKSAGLTTHALLTDMNEPLGTTVGHFLEMREVCHYLAGQSKDHRLHEVVMALAAEMLVVTGLADDRDAARGQAESALSSGRAASVFGKMLSALGGPWDYLERFEHYAEPAPVVKPVLAAQQGIIVGCDARAVGLAVLELGGGRRVADDPIDLRVGLSALLPVGAAVNSDRPLAMVHARSEDDADMAIQVLRSAYAIGNEAPAPNPVVGAVMTRAVA